MNRRGFLANALGVLGVGVPACALLKSGNATGENSVAGRDRDWDAKLATDGRYMEVRVSASWWHDNIVKGDALRNTAELLHELHKAYEWAVGQECLPSWHNFCLCIPQLWFDQVAEDSTRGDPFHGCRPEPISKHIYWQGVRIMPRGGGMSTDGRIGWACYGPYDAVRHWGE